MAISGVERIIITSYFNPFLIICLREDLPLSVLKYFSLLLASYSEV